MAEKKLKPKKLAPKSRNRNFREVVQVFPELEADKDIEEVSDLLDKAQDLVSFVDSVAGKDLIETQVRGAKQILNEVLQNFTKLPVDEIRALLARLEARTKLILEMQGASESAESLQELLDKLIIERT
jgi:hypothetical protein